tara:strand:+ start:1386 stop:2525 length:1140 start_codon:yes stop_codon:yes gene_type:complete
MLGIQQVALTGNVQVEYHTQMAEYQRQTKDFHQLLFATDSTDYNENYLSEEQLKLKELVRRSVVGGIGPIMQDQDGKWGTLRLHLPFASRARYSLHPCACTVEIPACDLIRMVVDKDEKRILYYDESSFRPIDVDAPDKTKIQLSAAAARLALFNVKDLTSVVKYLNAAKKAKVKEGGASVPGHDSQGRRRPEPVENVISKKPVLTKGDKDCKISIEGDVLTITKEGGDPEVRDVNWGNMPHNDITGTILSVVAKFKGEVKVQVRRAALVNEADSADVDAKRHPNRAQLIRRTQVHARPPRHRPQGNRCCRQVPHVRRGILPAGDEHAPGQGLHPPRGVLQQWYKQGHPRRSLRQDGPPLPARRLGRLPPPRRSHQSDT